MKALTTFGSMATVILALLTVISLAGCGATAYSNTKYKFSLKYPSNMTVHDENTPLSETATEALYLTGDNTPYMAYVYVSDVGGASLLSVEASEKESLTGPSNDKKITDIKDETTTLGGQPAMQISYNSDDSEEKDFNQEVFTIKDGKEYQLEVGAPSADYSKAPASDPFQNMKESFKFL